MNKRILSLLLLTGSVFCSQAQKGTVLVYGIGGIHREKEPNDDKTTVFTISPGVGYQFTGNWTAGVAGSYGRQKFKPETGAENRKGCSGGNRCIPKRTRPFDREAFYPLRMCVGGLHIFHRASRRAGVHSQNRGRSLDSYCRRQIRPASRIRPPVLNSQTKDAGRCRQLKNSRSDHAHAVLRERVCDNNVVEKSLSAPERSRMRRVSGARTIRAWRIRSRPISD